MQIFSYFFIFRCNLVGIIFLFSYLLKTKRQKNEIMQIAPIKSYLLIKVIITSVLSFLILITLIYFVLDLEFLFKQ